MSGDCSDLIAFITQGKNPDVYFCDLQKLFYAFGDGFDPSEIKDSSEIEEFYLCISLNQLKKVK